MTTRRVHVIGAGLAGLSAAVRLADAGAEVVVHEATSHAGGRCRSFRDPALGRTIDNGNHLLLSGNRAALGFLRTIGAEDKVSGPPSARFAFVDLPTRERWTLDLGGGRLPGWLFARSRRVPGTAVADYLPLLRLLWPAEGCTVGDLVRPCGPAWERLLEPMLIACLNDDPETASARLAAAVIRGSVTAGGRNCRPLIAHDGLSAAFVEPALAHLARKGATVRFGEPLGAIRFDEAHVRSLDFGEEPTIIAEEDRVVLATPAEVAARLVPDLETPSEFRAIANIHFLIDGPLNLPPLLGVVHGVTQWIFSFPGRLAITISNAGESLLRMPREDLAARVWSEVSTVAGLPERLPPWQVIRERRATFAARPEQDRRRPAPRTRWRNLFLAGDWTATGLPSTIEGAIRSGDRAAALAA